MSGDSTVVQSHALDAIFRARSVALIGASANPRKLNAIPLQVLRTTGFPGQIYPVNPKYEEIEGVRCFPNLSALPEAPDVALILVPAADVPATLDECGRKGTRAAVVFSSGFEEVADSAGLVASLRAACKEHRIALVGPNCEGVWSVRDRVLLTFGSAARRETLAHSPIAMVSQSGSIAGAVARQLQDSGFGCAYIVSAGNETILTILDYLEYLIVQDDVRVVLLFLEGLKDGERLVRLANQARARGIALVALKTGGSTAGREAVASHTGKLTTTHAIYRDIFRQAGIIQVESLVELIEAAEVLSSAPLPPQGSPESGVAVFSIPGGTRALTADLCEARGVPLARFEASTTGQLTAVLPRFGVATNPTDVTGQVLSQPELFETTLAIVARDINTTGLLVQLANRGPADAVHYRDAIVRAAEKRSLPTVISFLGDVLPGSERRSFAQNGLLCARDPADAVRYFDWLFQAKRVRERAPSLPPAAPAYQSKRLPSGWAGAMQLLGEAGIAVPPWILLPTGARAAIACAALRFPVALKVLPEQSQHKTEQGLLRLNLATAHDVDAAAKDLRAALAQPDATLVVQEMVAQGVESVLTAMHDPDFGPLLAIGTGGTLIEFIRDIGYVSLPIGDEDIARLIERLELARLLRGYRGAPPADRRALVAAATGLADAFEARRHELREVEINPLIVLPEGRGVVAVDVLVTSSTPGH
jgi:acyl-CoA synthetase (NDP forming)